MMLFQKDLPIEQRIFRGNKNDFLVLGREEIKIFEPSVKSILISVSDPENDQAEIIESENFVGILRLKFHDIGKAKAFENENNIDVSMNIEDAKKIWNFVFENLSKAELIVCQCEQGVSRSSAIAAAISRILQNDDEYFFEHFWVNRYVYDLLIEPKPNF